MDVFITVVDVYVLHTSFAWFDRKTISILPFLLAAIVLTIFIRSNEYWMFHFVCVCAMVFVVVVLFFLLHVHAPNKHINIYIYTLIWEIYTLIWASYSWNTK